MKEQYFILPSCWDASSPPAIYPSSGLIRGVSRNVLNNTDEHQGTATCSLISSIVAEIFLEYHENLTIKHWMKTGETVYCNRYVNDIIMVSDSNRTNEKQPRHMKAIHQDLEFKPTEENNGTINYLDMTVSR
jgi:hypothetical protein